MLAFLPWLRLREPVRLGPFHVFPYRMGDQLPEGVGSTVVLDTLNKVLSLYRQSATLPMAFVCVLQYDGRPLGTDFDEAERAAAFRFGQHLAVAGMSERRFIGGYVNDYTASGHYQVIVQAFSAEHVGSVAVTHRRKGGHINVLMGQSDVHFALPAHLVFQGQPTLNLPLLTALQATQSLPTNAAEHVDASVTQYLLANSDSPDVSIEVETIATYAALERVTDSNQRLEDIQRKLPAILSLVEESPWTALLRDEFESCVEDGQPVLNAWLQQIYALRGNVAHGKPAHWAPQQWSQQEHLVAGAFVYPLVLKVLLARNELYSLTQEDVAHVLALERLLGERPFYAERVVPDESELDWRARCGWVRQFDVINHSLLGMALSGTIRKVIEDMGGAFPE